MSQQKNSTNYVTRICKICNNNFLGYKTAVICSDECKKINSSNSKELSRKKSVENSHIKYSSDSDINSFIECKICGYRSPDIGSHILIHNIKSEEYKKEHGEVVCVNKKILFVGENNPAYNHGGKLSPFSKNFIHYKSDEYIENLKQESVKTKIKNNSNPLTVGYYTSRGMSLEEAELKLSDRQRTFSLEKCIEKHDEIEGLKVWSDRQYKWSKSFKKQNYSKISQELFDELYKYYNSTEIYYATKDKSIDKNQEYRLRLIDGSLVLPDFICMDSKKIIEFDGDYWHSVQVANPSKEKDRDYRILNSGYSLLHIREYDFKNDRQKVIEECLNYLI